ncbi:MAG: hypothetical protein L6Q29_04745 [Candidatus Pacebacteria bacterium]|nr:hypothetical protein [Candidatus Paceibacterota bacterium]
MIKGRNILLLEPNYQNKYPPIGLMKIATYHRMLGDNVTFYKGNLKKFVLDQVYLECVGKLDNIESSIHWASHQAFIKNFIKTKDLTLFDHLNFSECKNQPLINECLNYFRDYYIKGKWKKYPQWDRAYVATLFTFYWKITIETIEFAKLLVKDLSELKVGGVMASLLPKEIKEATGIESIEGLIDKPGILDPDNNYIVDELPLDYSILDEIDYEYPTQSAYFTFMTKGCTRKCAFCSVPKLEPTYKPKIETVEKFNRIKERCGEQQNLLLMDNNVLASPNFPEIIEEIKDMGFYKGATYIEPNQLEIAIRNLREGFNDKAYIRRSYKLIHELLKRLKGETAKIFFQYLEEYDLLKLETTTKENLLAAYPHLGDMYDKFRPKTPKLRYVDFNQGTDCRYVTDEYMKLMSEIPIRPLRIAFDYLSLKDKYINAVELAAKYGIKELSNYILYNFQDTPDQLYERLKINVELYENLNVHIYSFPMKFIPLYGEEAKDRNYIGKHWNKKYIRAIQSIINVTKGIVAPGRSFFEKAFGRNLDEYHEILYMPEAYITYRKLFEVDLGYTKLWQELFRSLTAEEFEEVKPIIDSNDFRDINSKTKSHKIREILKHYTVNKDDVEKSDKEYKKLKAKYDRLIKKDRFLNLTLTYDFEDEIAKTKHTAVI